MRRVEATFVNNEFEPGWPILREDIPLGKKYVVDLDRVEHRPILNNKTGKMKTVPCVFILEPGSGWLPLEAFKLKADA